MNSSRRKLLLTLIGALSVVMAISAWATYIAACIGGHKSIVGSWCPRASIRRTAG